MSTGEGAPQCIPQVACGQELWSQCKYRGLFGWRNKTKQQQDKNHPESGMRCKGEKKKNYSGVGSQRTVSGGEAAIPQPGSRKPSKLH